MLPSAHSNGVGVRIASLRSWIPTPPILYLRFVGSLAVATQDSRPSGSLLLSRETLSFSASCRFIPAHRNRDFSQLTIVGHHSGLKMCPKPMTSSTKRARGIYENADAFWRQR